MNILFKRGNTASNDAYVGLAGSISIDTELKRLRIHDGITAGGAIVPNWQDLVDISNSIPDLTIANINGLQDALDSKAPVIHAHQINDIIGLQDALNDKIDVNKMGVADGVATLNEQGLIPAGQLPSFVDDVLEFDDLGSFPEPGERSKIYVALDSNFLYRWSGSVYVHINSSAGVSDTAIKLATARTIAASGDATWSVSFDGSANATATLTLATTGVSAGTYRSVTVDTKGRVTAGTNPTTLAGYGITDAAPLSHVESGGNAHALATTTTAGFMSAADKVKLDASVSYVLPIATDTVLGGVKEGAGVSISGTGVISAAVQSVNGEVGEVVLTKADVGLPNVVDYGIATQSEAETGTSNVKYMTPLRTIQTIEAGNFTLDAGTLA